MSLYSICYAAKREFDKLDCFHISGDDARITLVILIDLLDLLNESFETDRSVRFFHVLAFTYLQLYVYNSFLWQFLE